MLKSANNINIFKNIIPYISAIIIFLAITFTYFSPLLEGKRIIQSDVSNYKGMSKEITDYKKESGENALWTNSMFGGMPGYLISLPSSNILKHLNKILNLNHKKPANYIFLYLLGFYIALLLFRVNPWLSLVGAIAYAFSSYFFIIIEAGHLTKALALGYMPPIIAGVYYAFNRKVIIGSMVVGIFLSLQLLCNHLQITYYTLLIILIFGLFQLYNTYKSKIFKEFFRTFSFLIIAVILAIGSNFATIYLTYDYGKDSMRGKSELTFDKENKTTGLDKDYATAWSYGIDETLTLLIPNFKGGASGGELTKNSATYELFKNHQGERAAKQAIKQLPLYWGAQPFTSGPVYIGAIVFFFFVLGLFLVKGTVKWWLLAATIISILLAWGKNFMFLTDLFLDYFPGYNKFRTVSMTLVIAEFTMPLLGLLALKNIIEEKISKKSLFKALKYSLYIVGGITLVFALLPGAFFNFETISDEQYITNGASVFVDALKEDRKSLLQADAFRSLVFVLLSAGLLLTYIYKKINIKTFYFVLAVLLLADMWTINKRYLNNDDFVSKRVEKEPFKQTSADIFILKDIDPNYRVFNVSVSTFNDASTSYFHKSIGGYHGAKMKRYQELIDFHISKHNMDVLNMLNTKYFIVPTEDKGPQPQINMNALGNAWFVDNIRYVANADSEITALSDFNPAVEAIIDIRFQEQLKDFNFIPDSIREIKFIEYKPDHLTYQTSTKNDQMLVFSEIYYSKGWNAYVDNEKMPHFRCNYVLRGMIVPKGNHKIEFKFEPKGYYVGSKISMVSSLILLILALGVLFFEIKKKSKTIT
ncbi:MAG: YfhO family protein [Bacteroidales bacterium]|nr:YfhO family protein [Bacteroidales bacterium]